MRSNCFVKLTFVTRVIGGWSFGLFGIAIGGLIGSIIAAVVGATILIAIVRLIKRA